MRFEARYTEENLNVSRRDHLREFLRQATVLLAITVVAYLFFGFGAEQLAVHLPLGVEKALGRAFSRQIDENRFSETREYAQKILDRLVAVSDNIPPFDYRISIVESKVINAVALPAGRIVLFRGLLEKLSSEEALAMVMAHELGHYVHRDHLRGFGRGLILMAIGAMLGANGNAPNIVMPSLEVLDLRFSRKHEQIADYFAINAVFKAYGHVGGTIALYDILEKKEGSRFQIPLFSTHPITQQRKNDLLAIIESRGYAEGSTTPFSGDGHLPFLGDRKKEKNEK